MPDRKSLPLDLAWAAYLVSSWWKAEMPAPTAAADPSEVIKLLARNGLPLLTLERDDRPTAAALLATSPFQAAIAEQQARMARQQAAFGEIRARWAQAGIPAMFVKAMGPQPTFPYISNNLDILVPQAQQDAARKIVRDLGYVELRHIEEPNKFLFRRYHLGESAFDLHIHGRLEWQFEFVDSRAAWSRCAPAADCALAAVPAAEDGLLIALAHAIYENKALKLIELAKVIYAARRLDPDWDRVTDGARRRGWLPGLWFALALCGRFEQQLYGTASLPVEVRARAQRELLPRLRRDAAAIFTGLAQAPVRIGFAGSKRLYYEKLLADPSETPLERARNVVWHTLYGTRVRLRLRSQRPLLIALDGVDGSGKSAQAALFERALEGAAVRHRVVWARGGSSALLQPLFKLGKRLLGREPGVVPQRVRMVHHQDTKTPGAQGIGEASARSGLPTTAWLGQETGPNQRGRQLSSVVNRPSSSPEQAREAERAALFAHPLARRLWPWLIALELGASYLVRVRWPLLRGEVVVVDRYVLSALMELGVRLDRPGIARTPAARLLRWLAPEPGRAYWLDIPAEVALARKEGREAPDFLARQIALLPALADELGSARLDGTQPVGVLSDQIITETLRGYFDAHRTLLNGLFWANPRPLMWTDDDDPGSTGEPAP